MQRLTTWLEVIPAFLGALFIVVIGWVIWNTVKDPAPPAKE